MRRISYFIILGSIILDQISKYFVKTSMHLGERITILDNLLYITSHRNKGAAWGMLQNKMLFFYAVTVVALIIFIYLLQTTPLLNKFTILGLGLMIGGTIGNFIDRLFYKEVVDFIDVYIGSYDFPIFNIADSALVIGIGLVLLDAFFDYKKEKFNG